MNSSASHHDETAANRSSSSSSPFPEWNGNWSVVFCPVFEGDGTDEDDYNLLFEFITYGVLLNVIGVFGILGNVISMVILSRPQMKSSINYLLIGLARCDTVLIVTSVLLFGLPVVYPATGHLFNYYFKVYPLIAPVVYPIAMVSQTVSVYLTLTVTLERFVAVCHPLRARSLCTYGRARAYVVATIAFAVLYNVTRFLEVRVQKCMHTGYNQYVYQVYPSDLRNDRDYISVYIHWMYLLIMYFIPFGSLAVLNAAIYRQVRRANRERQRLSRLQKKEIGLATMLLCVVVVFLLCNVWALISNVVEAFYGITVDQLVKVSNLLVTINSSVNFVIYVIFGEKFKRLFFKLFFPRGVWMCGWHFATDGRGGPSGGGGGGHAAIDDSEATCNGATAFECRQLAAAVGGSSSSTDHFKRSHYSRHHYQHHHHHHHHHHHRDGNRLDHQYGTATNGGGGCGNGGNGASDDRELCSKTPTNSGLMWEHSTTTTTTTVNVHQI
ncbi:FMRFamide receptor [Myzus persicae]|uniref:FMRFamide receptor n=1 Tax=Myzus persicae TaxID=13164 RepID=UPI000B938C1E|nr:FMRFamide receptor [Myzus persicae]